ncbi:hypothetical protein HMPREF3230_00227 [Gardnerella vaginalis]|uniref:Uncharacterized protein n=1 Tax=Gardnerella vaginalis TaxID=2702 RepID=A0A135ZAD7_GARVA|nr:hypothetical protein HMPREF3230_00227 [Gardnerella vaginalis]
MQLEDFQNLNQADRHEWTRTWRVFACPVDNKNEQSYNATLLMLIMDTRNRIITEERY